MCGRKLGGLAQGLRAFEPGMQGHAKPNRASFPLGHIHTSLGSSASVCLGQCRRPSREFGSVQHDLENGMCMPEKTSL